MPNKLPGSLSLACIYRSIAVKRFILQVLLVITAILAFDAIAKAQSDKIESTWYNEAKDAKIQIYKANDGKYYGKIIWLKEPLKNGKPKLDDKNPNKKAQSNRLVGLVILKGFHKEGDKYSDGTIYDPENGKTYDCKMNYKGKTLAIRGYIGVSLFGRTTVWGKAS